MLIPVGFKFGETLDEFLPVELPVVPRVGEHIELEPEDEPPGDRFVVTQVIWHINDTGKPASSDAGDLRVATIELTPIEEG